jgi:hypothetical protein
MNHRGSINAPAKHRQSLALGSHAFEWREVGPKSCRVQEYSGPRALSAGVTKGAMVSVFNARRVAIGCSQLGAAR